jgi:gluconolactonase
VGSGLPEDYRGGSIQRVDLKAGKVITLYDCFDGQRLNGPNGLVFDAAGGFYFTDMGKVRDRVIDKGSVYYAKIDGSAIRKVTTPISLPNGAGLSADGRTLYVSETETGRLCCWEIIVPGQLAYLDSHSPAHGGRLVYNDPGFKRFDSLV